jgi:hypothetical protein
MAFRPTNGLDRANRTSHGHSHYVTSPSNTEHSASDVFAAEKTRQVEIHRSTPIWQNVKAHTEIQPLFANILRSNETCRTNWRIYPIWIFISHMLSVNIPVKNQREV